MAERQDYVDAASRALGILAAKARCDENGMSTLFEAFPDSDTMASGFILASEVLLAHLASVSGRSVEDLLQDASKRVAAHFPEP